MTVIPVVDLAAPDAADRLRAACEDVGFLSVVNHGVPAAVVEAAFATAHRFFALPPEQKAFATLDSGVLNRGYDGVGSQKLDPGAADADRKEVWDVGLDLPWDHPLVVAGTPMHGPNPWPDDLPWFRPPVEAFYAEARALTERLLALLAESLGLGADGFSSYHRTPIATMRLLHYPPVGDDAGTALGAGAHTDWGAITVLAQDEVGGLQVQDPASGEWLDVPPMPGAFVVNIGDLLARWTNDRFRSTRHRVLPPRERHRYSVVFFMDLDHHATIEVLPSCVPEGEAPRYGPTTAGEHLLMKFRESMAHLDA